MSIDPISLAVLSAGLTIAQAGSSIIGQRQQAKAQAVANDQQAENIRQATVANYDQLEQRRAQMREDAERQKFENNIDAMEAVDTAVVAASGGGVSGLSVEALLRDMLGRQGRFNDSVAVQSERVEDQIDAEQRAGRMSAESSINTLPSIPRVDYLGTALKAGASLYGTYRDHLKIKDPSLSEP